MELLLGDVLTDIHGNGGDDHQALDNVVEVGVGADKLQDDLQQLEHQHAHQDAANGTDTTGGGHAADGTAGDGFQLVADAHGGGGTAGLAGHQEAGEGVHQACGHVDQGLSHPHVDTGDLSGVLVAADGVDVLAVGGLVIHEPENQAEEQRKEDIAVEALEGADGQHLPVKERLEAVGEAADGLSVGVDQVDAVDDGLNAQGRNEGGHVQVGDDQAGDGTDDSAHNQDNEQHCPHVHLGHPGEHPAGIIGTLDHDAGQGSGQSGLTAGGQVGALGDQTAGNTQSDEESNRGVAHQVIQVIQGEEVIDGAANHQAEDGQHNDNGIALDDLPNFLRYTHLCFHISNYLLAQTVSNWVASSIMFSWVASLPSTKPVTLPSHMTMIRSDIPMSSAISEEIMMMLFPARASSSMMQ